MRIIIAPAKKMQSDPDSLPIQGLPQYVKRAERLVRTLQAMTGPELKKLWKCSDAIASLNIQRLIEMDLRRRLTPAVLAYDGIQYQYMAPGVMETGQLAYLQEHLRILSGLYGILRPFDGVSPYRLEMCARLATADGSRNLYEFWGDTLARQLERETKLILNLASKEYSQAVEPHLSPRTRFLTCVFAERKGGRLLEQGTACKMARGQMVRWLAEHAVSDPQDIRSFADLQYRFCPEDSAPDVYVFVRELPTKD